LVYDEIIKESKVSVLFLSFVSDVIKDANKLKGIILENKSGRQAILGKVIIDCTGDADIAFKSNVPFEKGGKDGTLQGVTLCFTIAGIDNKKFKTYENKYPTGVLRTEKLEQAVRRGALKPFKDAEYRYISTGEIYPGMHGFNFGHVYKIDGTKKIWIVDFLEIHENFYEIAKSIRQIHEKLGEGICFIAIQKKGNEKFGRGAEFSMEKSRLYLTLDYVEGTECCTKMTIVDAKACKLPSGAKGLNKRIKILGGASMLDLDKTWQK